MNIQLALVLFELLSADLCAAAKVPADKTKQEPVESSSMVLVGTYRQMGRHQRARMSTTVLLHITVTWL